MPTAHPVKEVPIGDIEVPEGRREPTRAHHAQLCESIIQNGLLHPIGVTTDNRLIYGYSRLEACKAMEWKTIPAMIHSIEGMQAELAEIDENLCRWNLPGVLEKKALARRKAIYEALHPETKHGTGPGRGHTGKKSGQVGRSFADDTAAHTGRSARSVRRDAAIGEAISDEVANKIADTPAADNQSELAKLAKLSPDKQEEVADKLASGKAKTVDQAMGGKAAKSNGEKAEPSFANALEDFLIKWAKRHDTPNCVIASVLENAASRWRDRE